MNENTKEWAAGNIILESRFDGVSQFPVFFASVIITVFLPCSHKRSSTCYSLHVCSRDFPQTFSFWEVLYIQPSIGALLCDGKFYLLTCLGHMMARLCG